MKIIKLQAENFKRLRAVEITPEGNIVTLTGKNGAGKTAVLDSIWAAIAGERAAPEKPVRDGAKKATIQVQFGELTVKRTFTEKGTTLVVTQENGERVTSPQTVLNKLTNLLCFDPLEFQRKPARDQFDTLSQLVGVDIESLDQQREDAYKERTFVNRNVKQLQARLDSIKLPAGVTGEKKDISALLASIQDAQKQKQAYQHTQSQLELAKQRYSVLKREYERIVEEMDNVKRQGQELTKKLTDWELPDISGLQEELATAEESNRYAEQVAERQRITDELRRVKDESDKLTAAIEAVDESKAAALEKVRFPVEGLGLDSGKILYNGQPLSQASGAEQLRVAMAIAIATKPKLRFLRVSDASLLDSESMKVVKEMSDQFDFQIWLEVVDESGKVGITIEDGLISAVN